MCRMVRGSTGQAAMELQPDGQPVSCVRFAPAAAAPHSAVVATVEGLYLLDLQSSPAGDFCLISELGTFCCLDLPCPEGLGLT